MPFPKWGGLPEVTSKLEDAGLKPLPVVFSSVADALNKGVDDEFTEKHGKTVEQAEEESNEALRKIQALIPNEEPASSKTVDQVMQESDEALRKIQAFNTKEGKQPVGDAPDDAATTVFPAWVQSKKGSATVFPAWVQPEDDKTTWWPLDGSATADDMTTVFPAVR